MNQIRMAGSRNRNQVKPPPGWTWRLPFKIYKNPKTGTFNVGKWKIENQVPRSGGTFYVSKSGNDTTGDGLSWDTAWLTPNKAFNTVPDYAAVYVGEGRYGWGESPNLANKNISMIGVGRVVFDAALPYEWSLVPGKTHTYTSSYGGPSGIVVDWGTLDADDMPLVYEAKSSINEVEATPGSFYCLGAAPFTIYVHPLDAGAPDADVRGLYNATRLVIDANQNKNLYVENVEFFGAVTYADGPTTGCVYLKDCVFFYTGLSFTSHPAILQGCFYRGFLSEDDAQRDLLYATSGSKIIEIDCGGHTSGGSAYNGSNVSTNHGGGENVIIGGHYHDTYGPPIGYINDGKCWLLGVHSYNNLALAANFYSFELEEAVAYLDSCISEGSVKDIGPNGETVHVRNFQGESTNDATVIEY